jgi:hypothetical protein
MKIYKKLADEFIRITRKYFSTGDTDFLGKRNEVKAKLEKNVSWRVINLLDDLAKNSQHLNRSYQVIYDTMKLWGYEIEEKVEN